MKKTSVLKMKPQFFLALAAFLLTFTLVSCGQNLGKMSEEAEPEAPATSGETEKTKNYQQQQRGFIGANNPFGPAKESQKKQSTGDNQCFCQLQGQIDDCECNVDTVDFFNNMKIFPRLQSLIHKPYFKYFQYRANKPCPFFDMSTGKCAEKACSVENCTPEDIPAGLKGDRPVEVQSDPDQLCEEEQRAKKDGAIDNSLTDNDMAKLQEWRDHDDAQSTFCDVDADICADCTYVDLTKNPERFTGYSGEAAHRIWRAIYQENCFLPPSASIQSPKKKKGRKVFGYLQDEVEDMCLEKRAFYRAVSGLHASITIHLTSNYLMKKSDSPFVKPTDKWGPNLNEFIQRFDPATTNGQGPYWLRNLYFVYLLELRALSKAAPFLEQQTFFTGSAEEDKDTQIAVKELLNLLKSFPDHFDETVMFNHASGTEAGLKKEFTDHFRNISRVMDCVGCDKCKLWGKLQVTGLGTALKILFSDEAKNKDKDAWADELQTFQPPDGELASRNLSESTISLSRNEIVSLFNAFARISTSIRQLEKFREMMGPEAGAKFMREEL